MIKVSRSAHLDGLRGIASLMVFFNHLALSVLPSISTLQPDASGLASLIAIGRSPLSVAWGGDFGVCIFFVLSGYVLSQFCMTTNLGFVAKLARRYARLALPMAFSTILAFALMKAGAFGNEEAATTVSHSGWLALWYRMPASLWAAIGDGYWNAFIFGRSDYNSNLWTMRIELVGSVAIFLLYSLAAHRWLRILVAILAAFLSPGYYSLFAVGGLLLELFEWQAPTADGRFSIPAELMAMALLLAGIVAGGFPASGVHAGISSPWHRWLSNSDNALGWHIAGAILVLIGVQQSALLRAALGSRAMQLLGRLSFPIYLIQIPLVCSFTALLLLKLPLQPYWMLAAVTIAATTLVMIPLAWLTYRFVEAPAVRASRSFGRIVDWGYRAARGQYQDRLEDDGEKHFRNGAFAKAALCLHVAALRQKLRPSSYCTLALIYLVYGCEKAATGFLKRAAAGDTHYWASDYDVSRSDEPNAPPRPEDTCFGDAGLLYAGYNFAAMRAFQVGAGKASTGLATKAVFKQFNLKPVARASAEVADLLSRYQLQLNDVRILPESWVSQIGHLGMLDIMLRMRRLGWWNGTAIVLAPNERVANSRFMSLVCAQPDVIVVREDRDCRLMRDLMSLIHSHGLPYHVFRPPGSRFVRWHEAAALAMHRHPELESWSLAPGLDAEFAGDVALKQQLKSALATWGIGPDDWYVCLHVRELGYHSAAVDSGHGNRNSDLTNYGEAIAFVAACGGRVIKMGAPSSPPCEMPGLIDYAHSEFKSEAMDIALIRHARYFIGTTSGLANVAVSLGRPAALVNCLTTEYQPWSHLVRFCVKPLLTRAGNMLSQRDMTSDWRWALATIQTMASNGLTAQDNSPDEILETVREVDALAGGTPPSDPLIEVWRRSLAVPHAYGAALPSLHFLRKHATAFVGHGTNNGTK
jgi:putative glycosyltransferase (TIGR04372 family)